MTRVIRTFLFLVFSLVKARGLVKNNITPHVNVNVNVNQKNINLIQEPNLAFSVDVALNYS